MLDCFLFACMKVHVCINLDLSKILGYLKKRIKLTYFFVHIDLVVGEVLAEEISKCTKKSKKRNKLIDVTDF